MQVRGTTQMDILNAFNEFESAALQAIQDAENSDALETVRIEFLGQKNGRIRDLQKLVGTATPACSRMSLR